MALTQKISNHNFKSFLWHATFLAFAKNFMDVDTIIPAMLVEAGGGAMHIGIMTAIMLGGSSFTQLFFAPFISNKTYKKRFLLLVFNTRIFALYGLGKSLNKVKVKTFFLSIQIIGGIIVLGAAFLVKKVLVWQEYPVNYAFMFFIGASLLLIASGGFWSIKEVIPSKLKISGVQAFFGILKNELKQNKKLGYFLGYVNTQGIAISFLPFVILYAKNTFQTQSSDTGMFLLYKVIGIVVVSLLVLLGAKNLKYIVLLYSNVALSLVLAGMALFISDVSLLKYIFIVGGIVYSLFSMSMNGLLLEVSGNENRALYTGFAGAGNILPALFPLIGGTIINQFGFHSFFILFMAIIASAAFFIFKIDCKK